MSDIVRVRSAIASITTKDRASGNSEAAEFDQRAADEIERLRALNAEMLAALQETDGSAICSPACMTPDERKYCMAFRQRDISGPFRHRARRSRRQSLLIQRHRERDLRRDGGVGPVPRRRAAVRCREHRRVIQALGQSHLRAVDAARPSDVAPASPAVERRRLLFTGRRRVEPDLRRRAGRTAAGERTRDGELHVLAGPRHEAVADLGVEFRERAAGRRPVRRELGAGANQLALEIAGDEPGAVRIGELVRPIDLCHADERSRCVARLHRDAVRADRVARS